MHFCERPMNLTRRACCHLVLLLNDTTRVPPCHPDFLEEDLNVTSFRVYKPPTWISDPPEVQEDHVTFLVGTLMLVLLAVACAVTLSKLTKPKFAVAYGSVSNYDVMWWMPSATNRRSSILLLLRRISCRRPPVTNRNSTISAVSSNIGLLPSYQTATRTANGVFAPPPAYEAQPLTS